MNNSFLNKFVPKEPKFFPLLQEMADVATLAADYLIECLEQGDHDSAVECYKKIKEQEKKGDQLSHLVFDELNSTFITPFDREDINNLANRLDDVTDYINSCAKSIVLYNPKLLPSAALDLAKLIKESTLSIRRAVDELDVLKKHTDKIKKYCVELQVIEHKADDVYEAFVIELFEKQKDAIELIKLKEIVGGLEKTTDVAELVGKIIKTIIVKYA